MNPYKIIEISKSQNDAAVEPVTLSEAKLWLKVTFNDDDAVITDLITSCRRSVEEYCANSMVAKTVKCIVDLHQPNNRECISFLLPYGPITYSQLDEIKVYLKTGQGSSDYTLQTLDTDYTLEGTAHLRFYTHIPGRYKFEYSAGYDETPSKLKDAIKSEVADKYENRGDSGNSNDRLLSPQALMKAQPFKQFAWL